LTDPAPPPALGDADDLRNYHARTLLRKPAALIAGAALIGVAFAALTLAAGPAAGAIAAGVALFAALALLYRTASRRADRDFFGAYAASRGLLLGSHADRLPAVTPLLREGDSRYARNVLEGRLPGGLDGTLALYTYVEEHDDVPNTHYSFTVALSNIPQLAPLIDRLYCQRRSGPRLLDSAEDAFRLRTRRVEMESEVVDRRYEIFAARDEDPMAVRQIFDPSFLVWLGEEAPQSFAFELEAGLLCCSVSGERKSAAPLDELCTAAATVAKRLLAETGEGP
jgi:hypothetical protein